jgi:hypothetical protein
MPRMHRPPCFLDLTQHRIRHFTLPPPHAPQLSRSGRGLYWRREIDELRR